jgi:hypothetical protein
MTSLDPRDVSIVSLAQNMTIVEGDEVVLKCSVHNMGAHQQIIWRRGFEVIAAGPVLLKIDFRYSVVLALVLAKYTKYCFGRWRRICMSSSN